MTLRRALTGGLFGLVIAASAPMTAASAVPPYPVDETGGLTVSATVVTIGSPITVSGEGYAANAAVTVTTSTAPQGFAPLTGGLGSFRPAIAGVQRQAAAAAAAAVVNADGSGAFSTSVTLGELGLATITASGRNPSGGTRTLIATIQVVAVGGVGGGGGGAGGGVGGGASGVGGDGSLPNTGASVLLPVTLGAILLLGGAGLVTVVRRRKRGDATA